jgi:glycosyltransferase involved in cell wall biosynthesis
MLVENMDDRYGGPARSVPYLCKYLRKENVDTEINAVRLYDRESNTVVESEGIGLTAFGWKYSRKLRYSPGLKSHVVGESRKNEEFVVHLHNLWNYTAYLAYQMKRTFGCPVLVSVRGSLYPWTLRSKWIRKKIAWLLFQKNMLERVDCIHATDMSEAEAVRSLGITVPIALIPNGVEADDIRVNEDKETSKTHLGLDRGRRYALFLSRLDRKKGLELLLAAWADIAQKFPDWDLIVAGNSRSPGYLRSVEGLIRNYSLRERVIMPGFVSGDRRKRMYNASDLFVLPSYSENFGMVIGEALGANLPVITTKNTPWSIIEREGLGWWIDLSEETLRSALNKAVGMEANQLESKGRRGCHLIEKEYSWASVAEKMVDVYRWILKKRTKPDFVM